MRTEHLYFDDIVAATDAIARFIHGIAEEDFHRSELLVGLNAEYPDET